MTLSIERLRDPDAFSALEPEWVRLDQQVFPRTPFTSPLWITLWWKHFRRSRLTVTDDFFVHTLRDQDRNLIALAPLMVTRSPSIGPIQLRMVQFFGADPSITELRGIICRPDHQREAIEALRSYLRMREGEWDFINWSGVRQDADELARWGRQGAIVLGNEIPDYVLSLPSTWDEFRLTVSSNMRKSIRKSYEFLQAAGHVFSFKVIEDPEEVPGALRRFFELHAARAEVTDMIFHPNRFAAAVNRDFFGEYAGTMAERGELRMFQIEIGGVAVASRVGFVLDDSLYIYYAGYDPTWRKYGVATTLMAEAIKWAITNKFRYFNLSTGRDLSKLRWKPTELVFRDAVEIASTVRGRVAFHLYEMVRRRRLRHHATSATAGRQSTGDGDDPALPGDRP